MTAEDNRQVWGSKLQFLLTCIGYAVGLGNLWRFPGEAYKNGGGAFLLPYVLCSVFIGLPCLYLELFLGQFTRSGASKAFRYYAPIFQGIGWTSTAMSAMVGIYYNVIVAICLIYLKDVVTGGSGKWTQCGQEWNTPECVMLNNSKGISNPSLSTDQYYTYGVYKYSGDTAVVGQVNWQLLINLFIVWVITAACLIKGVKWIGRISYVTATVPYVIIGALFANCIFLDGAWGGIKYFLTPNFNKMTIGAWLSAAKQMCLSLSVGYGGILSLSSYNQRSHNCFKDAAIVVFADLFMSVFGGCVVFATLGFLHQKTGISIDELSNSKSGLAFGIYPEALSQMRFGAVWGFLLFFMFFLLGISSQFGSTQTLVTSIVDQFPKLKGKTGPVAIAVSCVSFLLGLSMCWQNGYDIQEMTSNHVGGSLVLLMCFAEIAVVIHYYGIRNFMHDIRCCLGVGRSKLAQIFNHTGILFAVLWAIVTPIVLLVLVGFSVKDSVTNSGGAPAWKFAMGLVIEYLPGLIIPAFFFFNIYTFSKKKEGWTEAFKVQKEHPSYDRIRNGGKVHPVV